MKIFIYGLFLPNDKTYIGQTGDFKCRMYSHRSLSKISNSDFYKDVRKFGWGNIRIEIFESCDEDISNEREIYYIAKYESYKLERGYNFRKGGSK